jgi:predicted ATPase
MTASRIVKRVVLTGGPCGGKSTVQAMLSDVFENMGWKVFRVPETATVLLSGGVNFAELSAEQAYQFQKDLLSVMLNMEQTYFNLAESEADLNDRKVLVICDRGAMDASAYIERSDWHRILTELGYTDVQLRDERYDYVVHLVTAADGAEDFYSKASNHTRSEGVELAKRLDRLCQSAWMGHAYLDIIDNATDFDKKCHRVVSTLLGRLGLEDKRYGKDIRKYKFLVRSDQFSMDTAFPVSYQDFSVEHTILPRREDGSQTRIRRRTQDGVSHFNLTTRHSGAIIETRRSLTAREYVALSAQADPTRQSIVKKRRCFLWENKYYQLDWFQQPEHLQGLCILEAYFSPEKRRNSTNGLLLPPFIPIVEDVTGMSRYSLETLSLKKS